MMKLPRWYPSFVLLAIMGACAPPTVEAAEPASNTDLWNAVQPLLKEKCVFCHGTLKQEAGLRLDAASLTVRGGDSGTPVSTDKPAESLLLQRVTATHGLRMPPAGEGELLTADELEKLQAWVTGGAPVPANEVILSGPEDHWAYQPPVQAELPTIADEAWSQSPIDRFLAARQEAAGVQPNSVADRRTLLRRVYLDVIGLPPTPVQMEAFLQDESSGAYERVVDGLLARPEYGERWARHWMDVWRYSDWDGYKTQVRGSQRHIWRWRDWIVESLNADKGYDAMIREMLAGDELAPTDPDTLRATGFLARNFHNSNREIWMDAAVEHTAKAFLGITMNCAKCHDHKYDPISQVDYYQFRAIFEPYDVRLDRIPGTRDLMKDGIARVYDAHLDRPTYLLEGGDERRAVKDKPLAAGIPAIFKIETPKQRVPLPQAAWATGLRPFVQEEDLAAYSKGVQLAEEKRKELLATGKATPRELERAELQAKVDRLALESVAARWQADKAKALGETGGETPESLAQKAALLERNHKVTVAELGVLNAEIALEQLKDAPAADDLEQKRTTAAAALKKARTDLETAQLTLEDDRSAYTPVAKTYPTESTGRRTALANWIASPKNPLTARVAVNHIWLRHFGQPLVENVVDFGLNSAQPQQAALLDWLAVELMNRPDQSGGWRMKHIHRLILTSRAYQLTSATEAADAANRERDPENRLFWKRTPVRLEAEIVRDSLLAISGTLDPAMGGPDIDFQEGEQVTRRSLYFRTAYEKQMLMLTLFDGANPGDCYRRSTSVVPQQALALANSPLTIAQSRVLAKILSEQCVAAADPEAAFIEAAFTAILCRPPTDQERTVCREFLDRQSELLSHPGTLTAIAGGPETKRPGSTEPHQRARENLIHVLFNHNDFVTVR